jgi:hypothetical protein
LHSEPNLTERLDEEEEKRRTNALLFRFFSKLLDGFMKLQNTAHLHVEPFRAEIISKLSALFDTGVMLVMELPADAFSDVAIHSALVKYVTTTAPTLCSTNDLAASGRAVPSLAQAG